MKAYVFQPRKGATNPLRLPRYPTRAEREKAIEELLIALSKLRDDRGLYINTSGFVMRIADIYQQAEDAK